MRFAIVLVLLAGLVRTTHADDSTEPEEDVHVAAITIESLFVLGVPTAYYWNTKEHQALDWTLDWDWESWEAKLLSTSKLKFDTNPFHVNALRHPLVGVLDYQIGRTNGLGPAGSMILAYATGVLWEFFIEYKEAPAINDMIANGAGGVAIGEPLYQIGQIWRSPSPSLLDRAHTFLFSPWDAAHDVYRDKRKHRRFAGWRSIVLASGSAVRWSGGETRRELSIDADVEVVTQQAFVNRDDYAGPIAWGAWNRVHAGASLGDDPALAQTFLHTRTVFGGSYQQTKGNGWLAAIGTGFTYRYDRRVDHSDRLGIFHLAGPQLQFTMRRADRALWLDLASYGDFALVDPLVFEPLRALPPPPPFFTSLQADGYYYAAGFSVIGRVRAATGPWLLDVEVGGHQFWQIDGHTLHNVDLADGRPLSELMVSGMEDLRVLGAAKLGYRPGRWGIATTLDGAYRRGEWRGKARGMHDVAAGLLLELDY